MPITTARADSMPKTFNDHPESAMLVNANESAMTTATRNNPNSPGNAAKMGQAPENAIAMSPGPAIANYWGAIK